MTARSVQTLPNGLRVVAVHMPHLHSAELALYIKAGGRNSPPGKEGLAHFVEHMLFRGTADYPTSTDIENAFEEIGGSVNASTDEECTCFFSRIHPDHLARALEILSSMILRPLLTGIDTEKKIITEEALDDLNENGEEVNPHNLAGRLLWPDHPLGEPIIGTLHSIASFTDSDIKDYIASFYLPHNAVLAVAGNFSLQELSAVADPCFRSWQGGITPMLLHPNEQQVAPRSSFFPDPDSQAHLHISFRGFSRNDERIMALRFLHRILCGSGSARLNLTLREKLGIVYSVDANIAAYEETGCFAIELSTAPENLVTAVAETLDELYRLTRKGVNQDELERVRTSYFYELEYSRDSCVEMQIRYGWGELMGIVRDLDDDISQASSITTAALQEVAARLFSPSNLNLVVVGSWSEQEKLGVLERIDAYVADWGAA
jgi:predicted Zn-dependent peptidase